MKLRTTALWLAALLAATAIGGCLSDPMPDCYAELIANPPLMAECRALPESAEYLKEAGERFSERLVSWHSYPGRLDVSVGYGSDARIQSVCLRQSEGDIVRERAGSAVNMLIATRAAPSCFAGHRVELKWESSLVTVEEYRRVERHCRDADDATPAGNPSDLCLSLSDCEEVGFGRPGNLEQDAEVACMLRYLPVSFTWLHSDELLTFLPREGRQPGREAALDASRSCEGTPSREALVSCMRARGWEPVNWEQRRKVIMSPVFE